ncbi:MAG TPA: class I SAM-dependent methyltransferase, partial [Blastocatellia bacterium]|nr:class I SAM-dependent methyltransferase [Blastocatellia bacterium]
TVFLLDVIEHLEKEESLKLLRATEQIARQQVIIFTPLGFLPQEHPDGKDHWGMEGGSWQTHKSGWLPEDFDDSWDIYAARAYHTHDNLGSEFEKPYGAMWAIKNIKDTSRNGQIHIIGKRQKAHVMLDKMIDFVTGIYRNGK